MRKYICQRPSIKSYPVRGGRYERENRPIKDLKTVGIQLTLLDMASILSEAIKKEVPLEAPIDFTLTRKTRYLNISYWVK